MTVVKCDRCKQEDETIGTYVLPLFTASPVEDTMQKIIYGHPFKCVDLCPKCKNKLERLLNDFLEDKI